MLNQKNVPAIHEIKAVFEKENSDVGMTILDLFASFRPQKLAR